MEQASRSNPPGKPQTEQEKSDIALAYKDQGYHEMEFTSGNESELHDRKQNCQKNPGHLDFIPAKKFTHDHLPERHRDSLVFDYITTMISLTVRLAVSYTSEDRPPDYPLHNRRGNYGLTAFGSGMVCRVDKKKSTEMAGRKCPCKACQQSPEHAKTQWAEFEVWTAKHVVFDTSEAECTRCDLFYDDDEDVYTCPSLEGMEVARSHIGNDHCFMRCVTHNEDVYNKMEEMVRRYKDLHDKIRIKYSRSPRHEDMNSVVVVSHPHGGSKHVTVGQLVSDDVCDMYRSSYLSSVTVNETYAYSAETCAGSSGAPVCVLGVWNRMLQGLYPYNLTHSGCKEKGKNESTTWWAV